MEMENLTEFDDLCDQIGLHLIDVADDVRKHFKDSEARARILRNLQGIQRAVLEMPRDIHRISMGGHASKFKYEWS
jgi:hypothetical protein